MMLSMHSRWRDMLQRRGQGLTLLILGLSVFSVATAFAHAHVSVSSHEIRLVELSGISACVIFFLALLELVTDWRGTAGQVEQSVEALTEAKRELATASDDESKEIYDRFMQRAAVIPDKRFAELKAYHERKVALSKLISRHPGAPVLLLRAKLGITATWGALKGKS
jgi:hypothetical protein